MIKCQVSGRLLHKSVNCSKPQGKRNGSITSGFEPGFRNVQDGHWLVDLLWCSGLSVRIYKLRQIRQHRAK